VLTVARHNSIHLQDDADDCDEDDVDEQEDDGIELSHNVSCRTLRPEQNLKCTHSIHPACEHTMSDAAMDGRGRQPADAPRLDDAILDRAAAALAAAITSASASAAAHASPRGATHTNTQQRENTRETLAKAPRAPSSSSAPAPMALHGMQPRSVARAWQSFPLDLSFLARRLDGVALFQPYLAKRGLESWEARQRLSSIELVLLGQRCLADARSRLPTTTTSTDALELARWCECVAATPGPPTQHNTAALRTRVAHPLPGGRTLAAFPWHNPPLLPEAEAPTDHRSLSSGRADDNGANAQHDGADSQPDARGDHSADPDGRNANTASDDACPSALVVWRVSGVIDRVDDAGVLCVSEPVTLTGGTDGKRHFRVVVSAALRKGDAKPPTPKAMGEDAHVFGCVDVRVGDSIEKNIRVPFVAVMDGGGGHQLAQYGQAHLTRAFGESLQRVCDEHGAVDGYALFEAMRRADHQLFNRDNVLETPSEAYAALSVGHAEVEARTGLPPAEFVRLFQRAGGPLSGLNPMQAHRAVTSAVGTCSAGPEDVTVRTPLRAFDLRDEGDAAELQRVYELAVGTIVRIEVQLVMCAFRVSDDDDDDDGSRSSVIVTTFNRGDCQAVATVPHGGVGNDDGSVDVVALCSPVSSMSVNGSEAVLSVGARVTCGCDGHFEKVSLDDHALFDNLHAAASAATDRKEDPLEYVELLARASAWVGGGDDTTLVSAVVLSAGV
jgi:hypothetical protein